MTRTMQVPREYREGSLPWLIVAAVGSEAVIGWGLLNPSQNSCMFGVVPLLGSSLHWVVAQDGNDEIWNMACWCKLLQVEQVGDCGGRVRRPR